MNAPVSPTSFAYQGEPDLSVYIAQERRYDEVQQRIFDRQAEGVRGLSFYIGERPKARSEAELEAAARRKLEARKAYRASPIGRLYRLINELEQVSYQREAWTMRGILDRAGNDIDPASIGAVLTILAKINISLSAEAIEACAELLIARKEAA